MHFTELKVSKTELVEELMVTSGDPYAYARDSEPHTMRSDFNFFAMIYMVCMVYANVNSRTELSNRSRLHPSLLQHHQEEKKKNRKVQKQLEEEEEMRRREEAYSDDESNLYPAEIPTLTSLSGSSRNNKSKVPNITHIRVYVPNT